MASHDNPEIVALARAISRLFGWVYFLCWSISFYPQPLLNWRRRSTHGLAIEYPLMNLLGFTSYTISTGAFFFSPLIKSQYAYRHPDSPETTVRFNDFAFAAHALVLCVITYSQFLPKLWGFDESARQRPNRVVLGVFWGSILGVLVLILLVRIRGDNGGMDPSGWAWIDVIYAFGYIKLLVTVIKYMPQVYFNYKRKSTVGWAIGQVLLDFAGGILSISQLIIDASLQTDWSGITGNGAKLGLGNVSVLFDIIFMVQHYVLYRNESGKRTTTPRDPEEEGLLEGSR